MPLTRDRRRILLYCNRFSKVVRIRAAPDDQQRGAGQRYQSMLEWWSREKQPPKLSLECLLMYNFRVGDHASKNVKVDDQVHLFAGTFILRYR